jgi:hypothetical protein
MLPLGMVGDRPTRFTRDEQITLMSLWAIARSPLMHGGDMTRTDDFTRSLLTNDEVIAVNQRSVRNRPLFNRDELIAWAADVPDSRDRYLALFNARDRIRVTPPHARHRSHVVTRDPSTASEIDLDVSGASRLVLHVDPTEDGVAGDSALWIDPTLVFADGRTQPLVDLPWAHADALWDSASIRRATPASPLAFRGHAVEAAIATRAASRIEYGLPSGVVRFKAWGAIDERASPAEKSSVRFVVAVATPATENSAPGIRIPVALAEIGVGGRVRVRDLWTGRDVGVVTGTFAPEIPFHGAGLYRISPAP